VVTEPLEGETLRARLVGGAMAWRKAVETGAALAEGLAAAHSKGITHRDLKPENIFLTSDGRIKILDFGLARIELPETATLTLEATRDGVVLGTVGYMSPEQVRGERADATSDIFSLGCVLYEMVAGSRPFARLTAAETMTAILNAEPRDLGECDAEAPSEYARLVSRCLEKNPRQRFQSARDLSYALEAVARSSGPVAAAAASRSIDSIAVLPFANAGAEPDVEYLSDGITESIINSLSQLTGLRVVPRNTVFRYKHREVETSEVARDLKVRAVLTGRVLQRGETLVVSAELVDTAEEAQLWGERYSRKVSDIFAVEEEIARQIAEKLRLRLTATEQERLGKRHTGDTAAYQLYLKGRHQWYRGSATSALKAMEYFEQAIQTDPAYALAYAGLAECYGLLGYFDVLASKDALPRAKAAALKALQLDDQLAEAHLALAGTIFHYDWNWAEAEREFLRATALNPNLSMAFAWYGNYLTAMGRFEEGRTSLERATKLDPLSALIQFHAALNLFVARRFDESIEEFQKAVELDPSLGWPFMHLGRLSAQKGMHQEAVNFCQRALAAHEGRLSPATATLAGIYWSLGRRAEALELVENLKETARQRYVSPYILAWAYLGVEQVEAALECLEKGYEERAGWMVWLKTDPRMDPVRSHPRYQDLVRRMRFP